MIYRKIAKLLFLFLALGAFINESLAEVPGFIQNNDWTDPKVGNNSFRIDKPSSINGVASGSGSMSLNKNTLNWINIDSIFPPNSIRREIKIDGGKFISPQRFYKVLYRIDPRFSKPQIFIWKKDDNGKYISDLMSPGNEILANYDPKTSDTSDVLNAMDSYIKPSSSEGKTIDIMPGEVVTIQLESFDHSIIDSNLKILDNNENNDLGVFHLSSSNIDNSILYVNADDFCEFTKQQNIDSSVICNNGTYKYKDRNYELYGSISYPLAVNNLSKCPSNQVGMSGMCLYDQGRGMGIKIGGSLVKNIYEPMAQDNNNNFFYYHYSPEKTQLSFTGGWEDKYTADAMITNPIDFSQYIASPSWSNLPDSQTLDDIKYNFLFAGNYFMDIVIGQGIDYPNNQDTNITYRSRTDITDQVGMDFSGLLKIDDFTKNMWIGVNNPDHFNGNVNYSYTYYSGVNFSGPINDLVVTGIRDSLTNIVKIFYNNILNKISGVVRILLTLYVLLYGIYFIIGAAEFTAKELLLRCAKIIFITQIFFNPDSWQFFSKNVFDLFLNGIDTLMKNATGGGGSTSNVFGFIDPLLNTYLNPQVWAIIFVQLFQIFNGGIIISFILILGIFYYLMAIIMVIVYYLVTFVSICVMLSLAPIFFCMILFEQTRPMFEKYVATLLCYLIQPTILLIFILMIDQIVSYQLFNSLVSCEWGHLLDYVLSMDLSNIGVGLSFTIVIASIIDLPFIAFLPFFIPQYASVPGGIASVLVNSILFSCLSLIVYQAIPYIDQIVQSLMGARLPSSQGGYHERGDAASSIYHSIVESRPLGTSISELATRPITGVENFASDLSNKFANASSNSLELYNAFNNSGKDIKDLDKKYKKESSTLTSLEEDASKNLKTSKEKRTEINTDSSERDKTKNE